MFIAQTPTYTPCSRFGGVRVMGALVRIDRAAPAADRIDSIRQMSAAMWVPVGISFDRACERLAFSRAFRAADDMPPAEYRRSAFKAAIGSTAAEVGR